MAKWTKIPYQDQWQDAISVNATGYVIKAYLPGTTTPTPLSIDKSGSTTVASVTLNADGLPEVSGNEVAIYIDREFKFAVYENQSDADNDENAYFGPIDNIPQHGRQDSFDNLACETAAILRSRLSAGDYVAGDTVILDGVAGIVGQDASGGSYQDGGLTITASGSTTSVNEYYWVSRVVPKYESAEALQYASPQLPLARLESYYLGLNKGAHKRYKSGTGSPSTVVSGVIYDANGDGWNVALDEGVFVDHFGAKGDGTTSDTDAFNTAMDFARTNTPSANFDPIPVKGSPMSDYFIDGSVTTSGAGFACDSGLGCKITMDPDSDFILFNSTDEVIYYGFNVDGGWNGNRLNPASSNPVIRHRKVSGTLQFTGQLHIKDVWITLAKGDAIDLNGFGYSTLYNVTCRGIRQNGVVLYGEQSNLAAVTASTLYNVNSASCEYAISSQDLFAIEFLGCVWEACRGLFINGTSNRSITINGCYSEVIETGYASVNFGGSASGLGFSATGNYLNYLPDGSAIGSIPFRKTWISGNSGDLAQTRLQDDEALLINRTNSNGNQLEIERQDVLQTTLRCESGLSTVQQEVDDGTFALRTRDNSSASFGVEITRDAGGTGNREFRPTADNLIRVGSAARRFVEYFGVLGTINTSDEREKVFLDTSAQERRVAKKIKPLLRKYSWKNENLPGIYWGVSAQSVIDAFTSEGLNALEYGFVYYDEDTDTYGIKYEFLLAFIMAEAL